MHYYDHIVVGAGIEGSATAYCLAKNGRKTLLIEQYELGHARGSSQGGSRIMRKSYSKALYTKMVMESERMWLELGNECGKTLFERTGMLLMAPKTSGIVPNYKAVTDSYGLPSSILEADEARRRYPQLVVPDTWQVLFEPDGAMLFADKCLQSYHELFKKVGGEAKEKEKVISIAPKSSTVEIRTDNDSRYICRSIVLCLGAWTAKFVKLHFNMSLPLQPLAIESCYWRELKPGAYSVGNFPIGWVTNDEMREYFFLPSAEYPGLVKVCYSHGSTIDPDARDMASVEESIRNASKFVRSHLPQADSSAPAKVEHCIYTFTPDNHVILDHHPAYHNVFIAAGFSGHGFKLAPVIGKLLGSMAMKGIPENRIVCDYDLSPVRIDRFENSTLTGIRHMM